MSEKDDLQQALMLLQAGKRKEAAAQLLNLESRVKDKLLRLQTIGLALSVLDPIEDNKKLLLFSEEAIKTSQRFGDKDWQANFMSRKADLLMNKISLLRYHQKNLKLASGWIEFSTEADKQKYITLTSEIEKCEKEVSDLLTRALAFAEESGNQEALGNVFMSKASVESSRYMQYKMECMVGGFRTALWANFRLMRYPFFENLLIFPGAKGRMLEKLLDESTKASLKAAMIFEKLNDVTAGYTYYNLANHLKTAYRFRAATAFLKKAKSIADKHNELPLQNNIEVLKGAITVKNKDIPDYINGEVGRDL
ncbi:MAG: hypothetical protein K8Q97_01960 [Candidatus Andersenbacteria bacterium]|nr:hypothetical protein [Candidatus Andersenbacteria bacterium]